MAGRLGGRRDKAPDFPIAPVLEAFGAEAVPRVRGSGYRKMLCPFHDDSSPSASVGRYSFVCWACGVRGDAIKLLREQENLDYAGALARAEELAGGNGSEVPRPDSGGWGGDLLA